MTTLAAARLSIHNALDGAVDATVYRTRQTDYSYPAVVIGWPQVLDLRPTMGSDRDTVIDVHVGCEVIDPESSDDLLSDLLEAVAEKLLEVGNWDIQPATDFGEQLMQDNRTIIWCRIPVAVFS